MKLPEGRTDPALAAPCGMNCLVCYRHCGHRKPCGGCRTDSGKPAHCRSCRIKACVAARGHQFCYECGEFPCGYLKNLDRSYRTRYGAGLLENGREIRDAGLAVFLERQKARYTCPACGGVISIHDAVCSECGAAAR